MSDIALHTDGPSSVTCISNSFIDHYMAEANGEYVKIYLYLLRCLGKDDIDFSISTIAQHLGHTDLDVKRALQYWEARHLLRLEYDWNQQLVGICLVDATPVPMTALQASNMQGASTVPPATIYNVAAAADNTQSFSTSAVLSSSPVRANSAALSSASVQASSAALSAAPAHPTSKNYTSDELSVFNNNKEVKDLLMLAQCYSGKQLTQNDMNTIVFWYDGLSMSPELIEYLINYCASNGHSKLNYMNKIALSWADQGITTLAQAELSMVQHSESYHAVVTHLGLGTRALNPAELSYLNTWTKEYGFSADLIGEACSRAMLRGTNAPMKYANRILEDWHNNNVSSIKDVEALDAEHANRVAAQKTVAATKVNRPTRAHNFDERTDTDWEALELALLQKK
ncbi:MAG: DnaD domain protein [Lachnospiraceae bacterium]|nr:DnaD domain protein [Lachnospiraceae bacterium]